MSIGYGDYMESIFVLIGEYEGDFQQTSLTEVIAWSHSKEILEEYSKKFLQTEECTYIEFNIEEIPHIGQLWRML